MKTYLTTDQENKLTNWEISREALCLSLGITQLNYDSKGTYFIK